jgi:dihydroflavonol-4-reductase
MTKQLYLLTGAAGYLGSNISRALVERHKDLRVLVLEGDPGAKRVPQEAEIITGDLLDEDSLNKFFAASDDTELIVIHCASMVTVSPELTPKLHAVNVTGTKNIVNKCIKHRVKKLVYVSSTGAIPELPKGQTIREVTAFDPDAVVGGYGKTKAEATQWVLYAVREHGLDASIVFPSGIAGPNDYGNGLFTNFIIDYVNGKMPAGIAGSFNAVDVRDLAAGVIACTEKGRKGEGYILSNCAVGMGDLFHLISKYTGTREVTMMLPIGVAKFFAFLSGIVSYFTKKPGLLTPYAIYNMERNNNFSCEKAERELGFTVRPFEETIRDMALWLHRDRRITIPGKIAVPNDVPVPVWASLNW